MSTYKRQNKPQTLDLEPSPLDEGDSPHAQLSEYVAMQLREQIISGQLKTGQFLRIDAVAKSLRVSMTPVREGLLLLQSEAFVRLIPRRGFVVNSFSKQDLLDLFWAQAMVGAELASRAAARMSPETVDKLQDLQSKYTAAIAANDERLLARLGHEFHRTINLAADSPRLALLLGNLTRQLPNRFYLHIEGQLTDAARYHPIILNAIQLKDIKAAGSLMYRHISAGGEHLIAMLERQGVWGSAPAKKGVDGIAASETKPSRRRTRAKSDS